MADRVVFSNLLELLKAQSKDDVVSLCRESIKIHNYERIPEPVVQLAITSLGVKPDLAKQLMQSLSLLMKQMLFTSMDDPSSLLLLFPDNFHKNLKELLIKVFLDNANNWRNQALNEQVSLPRLVDFDWRVDVKTASSAVSRMALPTCLVQFKVQNPAVNVGDDAGCRRVDMELSKEKLDTMLDGLGKIRDQLNSTVVQR